MLEQIRLIRLSNSLVSRGDSAESACRNILRRARICQKLDSFVQQWGDEEAVGNSVDAFCIICGVGAGMAVFEVRRETDPVCVEIIQNRVEEPVVIKEIDDVSMGSQWRHVLDSRFQLLAATLSKLGVQHLGISLVVLCLEERGYSF